MLTLSEKWLRAPRLVAIWPVTKFGSYQLCLVNKLRFFKCSAVSLWLRLNSDRWNENLPRLQTGEGRIGAGPGPHSDTILWEVDKCCHHYQSSAELLNINRHQMLKSPSYRQTVSLTLGSGSGQSRFSYHTTGRTIERMKNILRRPRCHWVTD